MIHHSHPFPTPDDAARRFRGRLGGAVSLWTTGNSDERAGLTVSSLMVAGGEPGRVLALLDPDADLTVGLLAHGKAVVQLLRWRHRDLADAFAGVVPAPGGPWRLAHWQESSHGPLLADALASVKVSLQTNNPVGFSILVTCAIDEVTLGEESGALLHRRGRYSRG